MALIPTNEKLLMMEGDDEAWVDTHHGLGRSCDCHVTRLRDHVITALEQTMDKLVEMTMDSAPKTTPTDPSSIPLVGTATADEDAESDDSGPVADIDDWEGDDDPVSHVTLTLPQLTHHTHRP